jgi:hypothetical protein
VTGNAIMEVQDQIKKSISFAVGKSSKKEGRVYEKYFHYLSAKTESYLRATIIHFPREVSLKA